jgi:serine/threonine-protein phosphatase PP1 catalytic subunit
MEEATSSSPDVMTQTIKTLSEPSIELDLIDKLSSLKDQFNPRLDLKSSEIQELCSKTRSVLLSEPTLLSVSGPVIIAGDIHGQFKDLRKIFNRFGYPPTNRYLFLGDYVDRGQKGLEVVLLLFALKCAYPDHIYLLRGNHECERINKDYGFYDECRRRLGLANYVVCYDAILSVFNALPIAAVVSERIFCVHGGLSPHLHSLSQIEAIRRPGELPDSGLIYDLLWTDPATPEDSLDSDGWGKGTRGCTKVFGEKVVEAFLARHSFALICRSHGYTHSGYRFYSNNGLLTIFSAPNYCSSGNTGAVLLIDDTADAKIHLFA